MRLSWVCVDVSQIVTVRPIEYAINSLWFDVAMCELWSAGHSAEILPVGALICLNVGLAPQHEMTMRWSLPHQRTLVAFTSPMARIKRPLLLSQIRTDPSSSPAIRSPCSEYLAVFQVASQPQSSFTRLRVTISISQTRARDRHNKKTLLQP